MIEVLSCICTHKQNKSHNQPINPTTTQHSPREVEMEALTRVLGPLGYRVLEVQSDGHCLYRAVAHQVCDPRVGFDRVCSLSLLVGLLLIHLSSALDTHLTISLSTPFNKLMNSWAAKRRGEGGRRRRLGRCVRWRRRTCGATPTISCPSWTCRRGRRRRWTQRVGGLVVVLLFRVCVK